jgi:nucleoid-associated protein YgaU
MESRIPRACLLLGTATVLLLTACGDATQSSPERSRSELEGDLQRTQQKLERSRETLAVTERRLVSLAKEQTRDHRRIADMTARSAALAGQNRKLARHLAQAREQLARGNSINTALRQQRDQNARRVAELGSEHQAMGARLASAYAEIRRLEARPAPDQRRVGDLYQRVAAGTRELEGLRRYNGYLLQERSNLQAWLQEANATRSQQQDALRRSQQESARIESSSAAANQKLRVELEKAQAQVSALADEIGDANVLHAKIEQSTGKITKLQAANKYLVEKVEACSLAQQSSRAESIQQAGHLALLGQMLRSRREAAARQQHQGRFMTAQWQSGPGFRVARRPLLIPVASETDEQPKSTRREKELKEVKKKVKELEQEQEALTKKLQELETEYAAVKKQVQTLTWANEVLVKELDAAYAAGDSGPLPKGTRGMYVLRKGESLSRVAKAFYGDPERWKDIVAANKDKIPDPDMVKAGTVIVIPE